jgi:hypothetical protein
MRLSQARVEQALTQFDAQAIPEGHPVMGQLKRLFGDHTFFLAANGLNIVEPLTPTEAGSQTGKVVNVASWTDPTASSLEPHEPEATDVILEFGADEEAPNHTRH